MSTREAPPFSIREAEVLPTSRALSRFAARLVDTNGPRSSELGESNAAGQRVKAVDAAAICMESGCFGG